MLLLGRSGTGKTVCICDRIVSALNDLVTYHQIFITKSKGLSEFFKRYVERRCPIATVRAPDDADYKKMCEFRTSQEIS